MNGSRQKRTNIYSNDSNILIKLSIFLCHFPRNRKQISDDNGKSLRFDEIRSRSIRAAQNLRARGYEKGQILGIIATNSHHLSPIVFAAFYLGCPINTLDPTFGKADMKHMLNTTKPQAIFCDTNVYDLVKQCLAELGNGAQVFTFGGQVGDSVAVDELFAENGDEYGFMCVSAF